MGLRLLAGRRRQWPTPHPAARDARLHTREALRRHHRRSGAPQRSSLVRRRARGAETLGEEGRLIMGNELFRGGPEDESRIDLNNDEELSRWSAREGCPGTSHRRIHDARAQSLKPAASHGEALARAA
jgi:hypothetical protein